MIEAVIRDSGGYEGLPPPSITEDWSNTNKNGKYNIKSAALVNGIVFFFNKTTH